MDFIAIIALLSALLVAFGLGALALRYNRVTTGLDIEVHDRLQKLRADLLEQLELEQKARRQLVETLDEKLYQINELQNKYESLQAGYSAMRFDFDAMKKELDDYKTKLQGWIDGWATIVKQLEDNGLHPAWKPDTNQLKL